MNKVKLTRRVAAAAVSLALAGGAFAVAPLSADAAKKSNYQVSAIDSVDTSYGAADNPAQLLVNGI